MGTSFPKLNIAAFGMEKIVPDLDALGVFTRLLARSATGQPVTTYTSHYRRPREGGEYHIIIVDNGRSTILSKPDHIELHPLRFMHEYLSGISPEWGILLHLLYSRAYRNQSRYGT